MKVFIAGAGTMGSGIAQTFAMGGHDVILFDIKQQFVEKGIANIQNSLQRMLSKSKISQQDYEDILGRIIGTVEYSEAMGCHLAVEAALEKMEIKKEIFAKLDQICPAETIFASNTSSLSITEMASATGRKEKFLGMHFFNPAPIMKLVELVRGMWTSQETIDKVYDIAVGIGKEPVCVQEGPGFVVNRVLVPMVNEAIGILAEGIASAQDIDRALVLGANHPMGPLALSDLVGNDVVLAIMNTLYDETQDPKYRPHLLLKKMVRAGLLGRKTGKGFHDYSKE